MEARRLLLGVLILMWAPLRNTLMRDSFGEEGRLVCCVSTMSFEGVCCVLLVLCYVCASVLWLWRWRMVLKLVHKKAVQLFSAHSINILHHAHVRCCVVPHTFYINQSLLLEHRENTHPNGIHTSYIFKINSNYIPTSVRQRQLSIATLTSAWTIP